MALRETPRCDDGELPSEDAEQQLLSMLRKTHRFAVTISRDDEGFKVALSNLEEDAETATGGGASFAEAWKAASSVQSV